jgi:DNA-binding beta-propeller fold protein YncE
MFDMDGKFLCQVGKRQEWQRVHGITFHSNGNAYITDSHQFSPCVVVCNPDGSLKNTINHNTWRPKSVALDYKTNRLFVTDPRTDSCMSRVHVLNAQQKYEFCWNLEGPQDAFDLAVNSIYQLAVSRSFLGYVQVFDTNGKFLFEFGNGGQMKHPRGIVADKMNHWYVCDRGSNCVQVYTSSGTFITQFGELGRKPGQLESPVRICVDSWGRVLVSDTDRIQVFAF